MTRLLHVHGGEPGFRRERQGRTFVDLDEATGEPVADAETIARVDALRIPPAWTDVWMSARSDAHLQASGLDSRRRRQYLYHAEWRRRRDEEKFDDMLNFAAALPVLRRAVHDQLGADHAPREHVLALAMRLLAPAAGIASPPPTSTTRCAAGPRGPTPPRSSALGRRPQELPTDATGRPLRADIERRVQPLLRQLMFLFFSNHLGCLGSLVVSIVGTLLLRVILHVL